MEFKNITEQSSVAVSDGRVYTTKLDNIVCCLNANTGAEIWNYSTNGSVQSCPTVANGLVYVGSNDYNMYCLNATTGAKIWNYTTGGALFFGSPAVTNGRIYFGSWTGIYCLNASTGQWIWNFPVSWEDSSPAVVDGKVYVCASRLYCLNASTGEKIGLQKLFLYIFISFGGQRNNLCRFLG